METQTIRIHNSLYTLLKKNPLLPTNNHGRHCRWFRGVPKQDCVAFGDASVNFRTANNNQNNSQTSHWNPDNGYFQPGNNVIFPQCHKNVLCGILTVISRQCMNTYTYVTSASIYTSRVPIASPNNINADPIFRNLRAITEISVIDCIEVTETHVDVDVVTDKIPSKLCPMCYLVIDVTALSSYLCTPCSRQFHMRRMFLWKRKRKTSPHCIFMIPASITSCWQKDGHNYLLFFEVFLFFNGFHD